MLRHIAAAGLVLALATPALAEEFNPLGIARDAAELGLDTARKAVDLGLDTAGDAAEIAEDAVTFEDDCPRGERFKDAEGHWRECE